MTRRSIATLVAFCLLALAALPAAAQAEFGIKSAGVSLKDENGQPLLAAGAHPDMTTEVSFNRTINPETGKEAPDGNMKTVEVSLPPGLIGDPNATPKCPQTDLSAGNVAQCNPETQVGVVTITNYVSGPSTTSLPVYNMETPPGVGGQFAFNLIGVSVFFNSGVTNDGEYALRTTISDISQGLALGDTKLKLWGVPADPANDDERREKGKPAPPATPLPSKAQPKPLMTNPTACPGSPLRFDIRADSWQSPGVFDEVSFDQDVEGNPLTITGCDEVPFEAAIEAQPTTAQADSPTGLDLSIEIPQRYFPRGTALLRDSVVTLPEGMAVNAASPSGQTGCTPAQINLDGSAPATCPESSKIGTVRIDSPLVAEPLLGGAYLAQQTQNKFGSLLAIYFAVDDPVSGTVLKLAGEVKPDPQSGQLMITFPDNPQLPFSRLQVNMFGGPRASLKTPPSCGTHTVNARFAPWSGTAPVAASDSFAITAGPNGGACPSGVFDPALGAGTAEPVAGQHSPFVLRATRADGTQLLRSFDVSLPSGLLARLAGTPYCPDAVLAALPPGAGTGAGQLTSPSCPAASRVGRVVVATGVGPSPFQVETGSAYLAGPYKGASLSLAFVTPAVAGPFDLGNVVVRTALHVDPVTTQARAVSDPLPTILHGIPLDMQEVRVSLDKPGFTLNPTSCAPKRIEATLTSPAGATAQRPRRFQVIGCRGLDFEPQLALRLKGGTGRGAYPALTATLRMRSGEANIRRASVALPRSEFLAQEHIRTICTRVQWADDSCPKAAIYGQAEAITPLLDEPLRGPVYLRSSDNELPDLVADLEGQIDIELVGRIDSFKRGIRTTFEGVPDAPVSKFVLRMKGGKKSLLVNSTDICRGKQRATVRMDGQNGRGHDFRPVVKSSCGKKANTSGGKSR
jgi:hypothetical protein